MRVRVLLFASLADRAGFRSHDLDLPEDATVRDAVSVFGEAFPDVAPGLESCAAAVNEEFASGSQVLNDADELAFIPPVSGG